VNFAKEGGDEFFSERYNWCGISIWNGL